LSASCGNEIVAVFRLRVGREINSAALIADGYHARTDSLTSLAVVLGATGVWLGFPLADPIVGLLITIAIFGIVWQSATAVLTRMLSWRTAQFADGHEDSLITLTLEDADTGALLTLVHTNVPDDQTSYERGGWEEYYFEPMKAYFSETKGKGSGGHCHVNRKFAGQMTGHDGSRCDCRVAPRQHRLSTK
jgi:hypothetical protein